MLDPLLYRWAVPPVVISCVHWTMQRGVQQTWITAQGPAIVMKKKQEEAAEKEEEEAEEEQRIINIYI